MRIESRYRYGYLTEVAVPVLEGTNENYEVDNWKELVKKIRTDTPEIETNIKDLCKQLKVVDVHIHDDHLANFGWLTGKLVCIDFGG